MTTENGKFNLKAVEDALEVLALAYHDERRKRESSAPGGSVVLTAYDPNVPLVSRAEAYRERIVRGPLAGAFRLGIRELGTHIWKKTGSMEQMRTAFDKVTSRHPDKVSSLAAAIDKAWDGIGSWIA